MHTAINGRLEQSAASQVPCRGSQHCLVETAKPHRISDLIPKSWDGSHDKGYLRNFMAELHLWMKTWSDKGEIILVTVESVDKVERSTLAVDCTEARLQNT